MILKSHIGTSAAGMNKLFPYPQHLTDVTNNESL